MIPVNVKGWESKAVLVDSKHEESVTRVTLEMIDSTAHDCPSRIRLGEHVGYVVSAQGNNIGLKFNADETFRKGDLSKLITEEPVHHCHKGDISLKYNYNSEREGWLLGG